MILAGYLGKFPHEIDEELPIDDFYAFMALHLWKPLGHARQDIQAALIASTVANMSGKVVRKDVSLVDFLPQWDGKAKDGRQSPEEIYANLMKAVTAARTKEEIRKLES